MQRLWILLVLGVSSLASAEFGWMPKTKNLDLRLTMEYLSTADNFGTDGSKRAIRQFGDFLKISEFKLYFEPEYSFTEDWAARLRLGFLTNSGSSDTGRTGGSLLSGSGVGDVQLGLKRRLIKGRPGLVVEGAATVPTYTRTILNNDELLVGDGSIDFHVWLHGTYAYSRLFFAASPYLRFRTGGYASQIGFNLGAGVRVPPAYFMPVIESFFSMGDTLLFDSGEDRHDAIGAGDTYLRLSGSPSGTILGMKLGANLGGSYFLDTFFRASVWGIRYPVFWQVGASFMVRFDFFEPDTRKRIHEIPFDSNPEDYQPPTPAPVPSPPSAKPPEPSKSPAPVSR